MRESLRDCQVNEPDGLWEGVQAGLDHGTGSRVRPLFWISAVSAAAAAAVAALLYLGNNDKPVVEDRAVANADFSVVETVPSFEDDLEDDQPVYGQPANVQPVNVRAVEVQAGEDLIVREVTADIEVAEVQDQPSADVKEEEPGQTVEPDDRSGTDDGEAVRTYWDAVSGTMDIKPRQRRLSLMASVGGLSKGENESFGGYGAFLNSEPRIQFSPMMDSKSNGDFADWPEDVPLFSEANSVILANLDNNDVRSETHHHQPIRYSLEVEYMFADRLGIVTGLSYSRLLSEMTSGSEISSYTVKQKLDYLGIPLALSWHMVDKNRFGLYARFGGMGEKALSGSSVTAYDHGNGLHDGEKRKFSEDRLQWSFASSLGARVGLWNRFSLFAEPGVSYYFKNGSDVDNIYKERPLNFNLNLGIRASLGR